VICTAVAVFALVASVGCATRTAAPASFEHLDECPNPIRESMSWLLVEGRVVDVTNARTFRIRADKGDAIDVSLANVGEPFDADAAAMLRKRIIGTRVSVMANQSVDLRNGITAEVHDEKGSDLSNDLLRAGAAAFEKAPAYTLSDYSECLNRIAEREAKAAGVGIWHH
jgi:endonuclease YncB( thermonuclease family)